MRIGLLTHSTNPRGGVVHTLELARALHAAGHEPTVYAPSVGGKGFFRGVPHAVSLFDVPPPPRDTHAMVASRIAGFVQHLSVWPGLDDIDVWHAHDGIGGNALADLVDQGCIGGFVRTVHHLDHFDDARVMALQRRSFERSRRVLCVSPLWCRILQEQHDIDAELVHNGVDLQRFQPQPQPGDAALARQLGLQPGAPLWLSVGGVEARKNTRRALDAFVALRRTHPTAQWVVAGGASLLDHDTYQADFARALQASGLGDAVRVVGTVADEHMPALFRLADGLLMPSVKEGFGLVVLEALASGTPVVVSRQAPFTDYLGEAEAHWCDPADPDSIASAMRRALHQASHPVPEVCRRHSWAASAARHAQLYAALTAPV